MPQVFQRFAEVEQWSPTRVAKAFGINALVHLTQADHSMKQLRIVHCDMEPDQISTSLHVGTALTTAVILALPNRVSAVT